LYQHSDFLQEIWLATSRKDGIRRKLRVRGRDLPIPSKPVMP
jgi:hypothetical protein